jgi:NADPH:quinone reductase-like Zn-dependent oxidoreductase
MPKAICADKPGGIEVLDWREVETPKLGPNDVWFIKLKLV